MTPAGCVWLLLGSVLVTTYISAGYRLDQCRLPLASVSVTAWVTSNVPRLKTACCFRRVVSGAESLVWAVLRAGPSVLLVIRGSNNPQNWIAGKRQLAGHTACRADSLPM